MIRFSASISFKSDTESALCSISIGGIFYKNSNPKKSGVLHVGQNVASMQERRVH